MLVKNICFVAFPMYVGMNRVDHPRNVSDSRVPHVRGDEPKRKVVTRIDTKRSPCTWG